MSTDFTTSLIVKGEARDLQSILEVLKRFEEDKDTHIDYVKVNNEKLAALSEGDLYAFANRQTGQLNVEADGPYGHFAWLDEVGLFEELAKAAPSSYFIGNMTGSVTGGKQTLQGELTDGLLFVRQSLQDAREDDPYVLYVMDKFPYEIFLQLFHLTEESFEERFYYDWVERMIAELEIYDCSMIELENSLGFEPKVTEDELEEIRQTLRELGIKSKENFKEELGWNSEEIFDAVTGEYI